MSNDNKIFVGIDVAKAKFDLAFSNSNNVLTFQSTSAGIEALLKELKKHEIEMVCLEATGNYQHFLVEALHDHGFRIAVVNPRLPRDFAKAQNKLAKTDRIDSRNLAQYAQVMKPRETPRTSKTLLRLHSFVTRRRQLKDMQRQESNRLESTYDKQVIKMIVQHRRYLDKQLAEVEYEIQVLISEDEALQAKADILQSVPGVGDATTAVLVTELPELGMLNRRQIARLIGVAPTNRDSGTFRGKRTIGGGRGKVRHALFMPTLVAVQHNPKIKQFYNRLLKEGKCKMVALIASMRKLLVILNTMIKNNETWRIGPNAS